MKHSVTSKIVALLITLTWLTPAHADKWLPPKPTTYESRRGTYRLTIFPAPMENGVTAPSQGADARKSAAKQRSEAVLERLHADVRRYEQVWRKPLINVVSPVSALVSEADGSFVTFDNWGQRGYGADVIVIYSGDGSLRRKFSLTDIMSKDDVERFPSSASSIHWSGEHELDYDGRTLKVRIVAAEGISAGEMDEEYVEREGRFRTIRIDMKTGKVLTKVAR
jgi:hypothetical protein